MLFLLVDTSIGIILRSGLHKYYGIGTKSKIALIGHSHLMLGIDKLNLEKKLKQPISKYTSEGVNIADKKIMVQYLLKNNSKTKTVIYGVDAWMFTGEGLSTNSYKLFLPFMDEKSVRQKVLEEAPVEEYWQKLLFKSSRFSETSINSAIRGHLGNWSNFKFGKVDTAQLISNINNRNFRKINSTKENRRIFEETLKILGQRQVKVVLVYVPTIKYYNRAEPSKFNLELLYFRSLQKRFKNVVYLEYLKGWEDKYDYFFDPIHLNPEGQSAFTEAFSIDLIQALK